MAFKSQGHGKRQNVYFMYPVQECAKKRGGEDNNTNIQKQTTTEALNWHTESARISMLNLPE